MTDLIDRQALLKELAYANWSKDWDEALAKAIIENMPQAQQWIPVSERLPKEKGIYPVWTAKGFGDHLSTSYWDGDGWSLRVVAWMPKPEPYKD